jgi:hypothetical protein
MLISCQELSTLLGVAFTNLSKVTQHLQSAHALWLFSVKVTESTSFALSGEMTMNQLKIMPPQVPAFRADGKYWSELRQAISDTSGFKRWVLDRKIEPKSSEGTLDAMVQLYLRQTLETLAY